MCIAIDTRVLALDVFNSRGMGRYINQLITKLVEIDKDNEYVLLAAKRAKNALYNEHETIAIGEVLPFSKQSIINQHLIFPLRIFSQKFDIVHYTLSEMAPCWNIGKSKTVITVPDLIPVRAKRFGAGSKQALYEYLLKRALKSSGAIIAISSYVANDVKEFLGASSPDIIVTPLAVNSDVFYMRERKQASEHVRERLGISSPFILYTGGFDARKQVSEFIAIFHDLIQEAKLPHQLVLAGRVEAYPSFLSIIREIARLKLQQRVVITDYVPDDDLVALYNAADAFVFPSAAEGFGLPLLEAMACGTPVVAFNNSSISEVVGEGGLLASDGDWNAFGEILRKILEGKIARDTLGLRAIEQASKFTWSNTARQTLLAYNHILSN